jgi:hypothetical protein
MTETQDYDKYQIIDHLAAADPHPQYALLAGRAGGQILIGGSGVDDTLKLQGTSGNGTLTSPAIQGLVDNNGSTVAFTVLNNSNFGIGVIDPLFKLSISTGFVKTDTTLRTVGWFQSNEVQPNNPWGMLIGVKGDAAIAGRIVTLQTAEYNIGYGGNIVLQPYGGSVGIGTTVPGSKFTVAGSIAGRYDATYPTVGAGYYALFTNNYDATSGGLTIQYLSAGTLTPGIILNYLGNVGIGVAPGVKLDISDASLGMIRLTTTGSGGSTIIRVKNDLGAFGDYKIDGSAVAGTLWGINRAGLVQILSNSASFAIGTLGGFDLTFGTNNLPRMTIMAIGNVGIGTSIPGSKLSVVGLPSYATDTLAGTDGLVTGDLYTVTGSSPLQVAIKI